MDTLIKMKAIVSIYEGENKRTMPIHSGYRPTFSFVELSMASGSIELIGKEKLFPGKSCFAHLHFISDEYLGEDIYPGKEVEFYEGKEVIGKAVLTNVI